MLRVFALSLLLSGLAAPIAWSDEPVSTAATADAHPPEPQASTTAVLENSVGGRPVDAASGAAGPCGPAGDTRPHGEVGVGVGTSGYREFDGFVCKALPNGGGFAIGVSQQQDSWGRR